MDVVCRPTGLYTSRKRYRSVSCICRASHPKASECFPQHDPRKQVVAESIRGVADFPKPGILFWDVTTLMLDAQAFQTCMDLLVERYEKEKIDAVAGLEARGLVFGAPLALALKCSFVMLRKPNKLPAEKVTESYDLEYGSDRIEMHRDAIQPGQNVLLVDDLIATGGTMAAGVRLIERVGAKVCECACVMELPDLHGRDKLAGKSVFVLITSGEEAKQV
mmetsp:Transcript_11182/g.68978  ORF Transcript_11182/g.68978 Transcript_11182/m.68978 type:complete len:220 (+) Transcript_11182:2685-3344(+)